MHNKFAGEVDDNEKKHKKTSNLKVTVCVLLFCGVVLIAGIVFFVFTYVIEDGPLTHDKISSTCLSKSCIHSADLLLNSIDENENVCIDFNSFVCKKFLKKADSYSQMQSDAIENELLTLLKSSYSETESISLSLQNQIFVNCYEQRPIAINGKKELLRYLDKLGGWPIMSKSWDVKSFHWLELLYKANKLGFRSDFLLRLEVEMVMEDDVPSKYYKISPPLNEKHVTKHMEKVAVYLNFTEKTLRRDLELVSFFESELLKLLERPLTGSVKTLKMLSSKYNTTFDWFEYIKEMALNHTVDDSSIVIFNADNYLPSLLQLIRNFNKRTVANYMFCKIIEDLIPYLPESVLRNNIATHENVLQKREERCFSLARESVPYALETTFISNFMNQEKLNVLFNIRDKFFQQILHQTISSNADVNATILHELVKGITIRSADKIFYKNFVDDFINRPILFRRKSQIGLKLAANRLKNNLKHSDMTLYTNQISPQDLIDVKVEYRTGYEEYIYISPGMFYGSYFDENGPYSVAFGLLSEKILSAMKSNVDRKARENVTELLSDVLSSESLEKLAYKSYKDFKLEKGEELLLPALENFSPEQIFWITLQLSKCSRYDSNFRENTDFQEDFGCLDQ